MSRHQEELPQDWQEGYSYLPRPMETTLDSGGPNRRWLKVVLFGVLMWYSYRWFVKISVPGEPVLLFRMLYAIFIAFTALLGLFWILDIAMHSFWTSYHRTTRKPIFRSLVLSWCLIVVITTQAMIPQKFRFELHRDELAFAVEEIMALPQGEATMTNVREILSEVSYPFINVVIEDEWIFFRTVHPEVSDRGLLYHPTHDDESHEQLEPVSELPKIGPPTVSLGGGWYFT